MVQAGTQSSRVRWACRPNRHCVHALTCSSSCTDGSPPAFPPAPPGCRRRSRQLRVRRVPDFRASKVQLPPHSHHPPANHDQPAAPVLLSPVLPRPLPSLSRSSLPPLPRPCPPCPSAAPTPLPTPPLFQPRPSAHPPTLPPSHPPPPLPPRAPSRPSRPPNSVPHERLSSPLPPPYRPPISPPPACGRTCAGTMSGWLRSTRSTRPRARSLDLVYR